MYVFVCTFVEGGGRGGGGAWQTSPERMRVEKRALTFCAQHQSSLGDKDATWWRVFFTSTQLRPNTNIHNAHTPTPTRETPIPLPAFETQTKPNRTDHASRGVATLSYVTFKMVEGNTPAAVGPGGSRVSTIMGQPRLGHIVTPFCSSLPEPSRGWESARGPWTSWRA